jgi:pyruvate dehydrogenase E1 component
VTLKYGALQRAAFAEPGGERLRGWIDACPNPLYSALTFQGGSAWRARLQDEIGDQGPVTALLDRRSDAELARLMENLGGHCLETLAEAFGRAGETDRPKAILAYTIKGHGLPLAGHKDNHSGLMSPEQMAEFRSEHGIRAGHEWDPFEGLEDPDALRAFLASVPFNATGFRRRTAPRLAPPRLEPPRDERISTQAAFGRLMNDLGKSDTPLADRIVTTSPDVSVSTNLGPWINRRELFAREAIPDTFQDERVRSVQKWRFSPQGQHVELGIAEMNLFLLLGAAGLSHSLFGERLIPVGTLYDTFIGRGLDALNYACYQDARFLLVATPSGVSLAPEGGAHQSIGTPLIGMAQDGLAAFEPAFADELAIVMEWAFDYLQREGGKAAELSDERTWLRDETGGSVYLRLSTRTLDQPSRDPASIAQGVIDGAYWLREPTRWTEIVLAYQGVVASEAIAAAEAAADSGRDVAVLAVTSADRLNAGWQAAQRARARGRDATSQVERLLGRLPRQATLISVIDGHPATLSWLGAVHGHRTAGLGVEHFGQTGTVPDLYRHYGIDTASILSMIEALAPGRPLVALP